MSKNKSKRIIGEKIKTSSRKNLNKQLLGVRNRRYGRQIINEIIRIFQNEKKFIKIQKRIENGRRNNIRKKETKRMQLVRRNFTTFKRMLILATRSGMETLEVREKLRPRESKLL